MNATERLAALTALLNAKTAFPKYAEKVVKGKKEEYINGNFEASPFSDQELNTIKALIFLDIESEIDNGRLEAKRTAIKAEQEKMMQELKNAAAETPKSEQ